MFNYHLSIFSIFSIIFFFFSSALGTDDIPLKQKNVMAIQNICPVVNRGKTIIKLSSKDDKQLKDSVGGDISGEILVYFDKGSFKWCPFCQETVIMPPEISLPLALFLEKEARKEVSPASHPPNISLSYWKPSPEQSTSTIRFKKDGKLTLFPLQNDYSLGHIQSGKKGAKLQMTLNGIILLEGEAIFIPNK